MALVAARPPAHTSTSSHANEARCDSTWSEYSPTSIANAAPLSRVPSTAARPRRPSTTVVTIGARPEMAADTTSTATMGGAPTNRCDATRT